MGSAVYAGRWRKEAATFLEADAKVLAERPVWLVSSGPVGEVLTVEFEESGWA
jgi:menaquinone-dependent protoporphyrinogen oxidase